MNADTGGQDCLLAALWVVLEPMESALVMIVDQIVGAPKVNAT